VYTRGPQLQKRDVSPQIPDSRVLPTTLFSRWRATRNEYAPRQTQRSNLRAPKIKVTTIHVILHRFLAPSKQSTASWPRSPSKHRQPVPHYGDVTSQLPPSRNLETTPRPRNGNLSRFPSEQKVFKFPRAHYTTAESKGHVPSLLGQHDHRGGMKQPEYGNAKVAVNHIELHLADRRIYTAT